MTHSVLDKPMSAKLTHCFRETISIKPKNFLFAKYLWSYITKEFSFYVWFIWVMRLFWVRSSLERMNYYLLIYLFLCSGTKAKVRRWVPPLYAMLQIIRRKVEKEVSKKLGGYSVKLILILNLIHLILLGI